MRKSKSLTRSEELFNALIELFAPFVLYAATEEIDSLLKKGFSVERLESCITFVEKYDTGRLKKAAVLHLLKKKHKTVLGGNEVSLSKREYKFIMNKMRKHLPAVVVRCWILAVTSKSDSVSPSEFDDAMLPPDAEVTLYNEAFTALGIDSKILRNIFRNVRSSSENIPTPIIEYLAYTGYEDGWK